MNKKYGLRIVKIVYSAFVMFITILAVSFVIAYLCGIRPYIVISGSMEPKIPVGSICFVNRNVKYSNVRTGDVITFKIGDSAVATHRAVRVTEDGIETKGDANTVNDWKKVTEDNYIGKVILVIPKLGLLLQSVKTPIIFSVCIILILLLTILGAVFDRKE